MAKSFSGILLLVVSVCVSCFALDEVFGQKDPTIVCSSGIYGPSPAVATKLKDCKDPSVYGVGPGKKNPGCSYFCMAKALNLLGPDGLPHPEISNRWVDTHFPTQYKKMAEDHIRSCYSKYGSSIDLKDENCAMAGDYNKCFWELQPKLTC